MKVVLPHLYYTYRANFVPGVAQAPGPGTHYSDPKQRDLSSAAVAKKIQTHPMPGGGV